MFIVLCLELNEESKPYPLPATKRKFRTIEDAKQYMRGVDPSRTPSIIDLAIFEDRG